MMISIIVLTLLLGIVFYAVMWDAKLLDSVAMMEDGRYTRRMVVAHMIWNPVKVTVEDRNTSLYIHDTKRTTLTVQLPACWMITATKNFCTTASAQYLPCAGRTLQI